MKVGDRVQYRSPWGNQKGIIIKTTRWHVFVVWDGGSTSRVPKPEPGRRDMLRVVSK